ncbi:MAG: hypothetical protein ACOYOK_05665 [Pseudobdellovibrionaceae bacterium]
MSKDNKKKPASLTPTALLPENAKESLYPIADSTPGEPRSGSKLSPLTVDKNKDQAWPQLQNDLQDALQSWQKVSQQSENKTSPDEVQLEEVKKILLDLKEKIKDFL